MGEAGNIPNLDDFLGMSWTFPPKNNSMSEAISEDRNALQNEEMKEDNKSEIDSTQSSEGSENIHDIVKNKLLQISKGAEKGDAKDTNPTINREKNSCPYFLRQRNTSLLQGLNNSQSSVSSNGNDPTWSCRTKLDNKIKLKRRKVKERQKQKFLSEPFDNRYDFRKRIGTSSYSEPPKFSAKGAHCGRQKCRRNSLKKSNSCSEYSLTELEYLTVQKLNANTDFRRKPFDIIKRNAANKRKIMRCTTEDSSSNPLKIIISSRKSNKANIEQTKINLMLLDISIILNELESTLTDWNFRRRTPSAEEASNLLVRLFGINTSLKEEYNVMKYQLNQYDSINTILDYLRKCEDLQSALKRRIKKMNRIKSSSKENDTSSFHVPEDLKIHNLFNEEEYASKRNHKIKSKPQKKVSESLEPSRVSSDLVAEASASGGKFSDRNDPVKERPESKDCAGDSLLFSGTQSIEKLIEAEDPSISTSALNNLFPQGSTSSKIYEGRKNNSHCISPDLSLHISETNCEGLQDKSTKKQNECHLFLDPNLHISKSLNFEGLQDDSSNESQLSPDQSLQVFKTNCKELEDKPNECHISPDLVLDTSKPNCGDHQNKLANNPNDCHHSSNLRFHISKPNFDGPQNKPNTRQISDSSKCKDVNKDDNCNNLNVSDSNNQTHYSTNKTVNAKIHDKSLTLSNINSNDFVQDKKNNSDYIVFEEARNQDNPNGNASVKSCAGKSNANGNYNKKTLCGVNVRSNNKKESFCSEKDSGKCTAKTLSKSNSIEVPDILKNTSRKKHCLIAPSKLVLASSNKNLCAPKVAIEGVCLNNKTRSDNSNLDLPTNPKQSNTILFTGKEIKTLNSAPKKCDVDLSMGNDLNDQYKSKENSTNVQKEKEVPFTKNVLLNENNIKTLPQKNTSESKLPGPKVITESFPSISKSHTLDNHNVDISMIGNDLNDQYDKSKENSTNVKKEKEVPITKIAFQNKNNNKTLPQNNTSESKLPGPKVFTQSFPSISKSDTLDNHDQARNKYLNLNLDFKGGNNEIKLSSVQPISNELNGQGNHISEAIELSNSGIHSYDANLKSRPLVKNFINDISLMKVSPNLNNKESPPIFTEQFLMENSSAKEFSVAEHLESPLELNIDELDSENQNINAFQLDLSISDIFGDDSPLGFDVQSHSEIEQQNNNLKTRNAIGGNFTCASSHSANLAQQLSNSHDKGNNSPVFEAATVVQKAEYLGQNKMNIDTSKVNLKSSNNGLLESSSVLENNKNRTEKESRNERPPEKPTSKVKSCTRDGVRSFKIEDIKYRRIFSSGEFVQVDNIEDLFTPNEFVW